jgi:hypothetical protein
MFGLSPWNGSASLTISMQRTWSLYKVAQSSTLWKFLDHTRFSWSDLRSNKIVNKNQERGWIRNGPRCPKQVSLKSDLLLPHKVFESLCFSASVNFKAFFDGYFVVKSHWRLSKLLVESNEVSKSVLRS